MISFPESHLSPGIILYKELLSLKDNFSVITTYKISSRFFNKEKQTKYQQREIFFNHHPRFVISSVAEAAAEKQIVAYNLVSTTTEWFHLKHE